MIPSAIADWDIYCTYNEYLERSIGQTVNVDSKHLDFSIVADQRCADVERECGGPVLCTFRFVVSPKALRTHQTCRSGDARSPPLQYCQEIIYFERQLQSNC